MRFIATSSFRNTHKFKIPGAVNDFHIHKGAIFEVNLDDPKTAEVVAILGFHGRIADTDNQPEAVAQIQAEVELEKKLEAAALAKTESPRKI